MKLRIFNKGKGWYVSAKNYKDDTDKAYMNVYFTRDCGEPVYIESDKGYSVIDVDVLEATFTSYKQKIGMTVFKYVPLNNIDLEDTSKFEHTYENIKPEDLPFY